MTGNEFNAADIESLLTELETRLRERGVAASVYIVGGAAIALREVTPDRRTGDIDAYMVPEVDVLAAAAEVARAHQLRSNWLNSSARGWIPSVPAEAQVPPAEPGLARYVAPEEHLLAMKLIAARGQRDMQDVLPLCRRLGLSKAEDIADLVHGVYGDALEFVHGGYADTLLYCRHVERLLATGNESSQG